MESVVALFLAALCVLIALPSGDAVRCYQCNTFKDGNDCEVNYKKFMSNCTDINKTSKKHYTQCVKIIQDVGDLELRTIRQCAGSWEKKEPECVVRTGTHKIKMTYCHCDGDDCNSAPKTIAGFTALLVALAARFL